MYRDSRNEVYEFCVAVNVLKVKQEHAIHACAMDQHFQHPLLDIGSAEIAKMRDRK